MKNVVDRETNEHNDCYWLILAKLKTIPVHESDDTQNNSDHAEDWGYTYDEVSSNEY